MYRQTLMVGDTSGGAWMGLGVSLARQQRVREARAMLDKAPPAFARQLKGTALAGVLFDLADEMQKVQGHDASLKVIERALKLNPASARGHHLHAQALMRMGLVAQARTAAQRAVKLAGATTQDASNADILLAVLEARAGEFTQAAQRLADVGADKTDPNRARALLELGRLHDRRGEYAQAFDCLSQAGQAALGMPEIAMIDRDAVARDLAHDATLAANWPFSVQAGDAPTPVFMIGFYRSGTTLLEQMLAAHPAIVTSDEADLLPYVLRKHAAATGGQGWAKTLAAGGADLRGKLREMYWQRARTLFGDQIEGRLLIDKTALNTVNLAFIRALFPEAKILFVVRDPRDVCISAFMQAFKPNPLTAQFLEWERGLRFYAAVMGHALQLRQSLGFEWLTLRYEDLIADFEREIVRVLTYLNLPWDAGVLDYRKAPDLRHVSTPSHADVAKPIYRDAQGRWQNYRSHFEAHAGLLAPYRREWGYDDPV